VYDITTYDLVNLRAKTKDETTPHSGIRAAAHSPAIYARRRHHSNCRLLPVPGACVLLDVACQIISIRSYCNLVSRRKRIMPPKKRKSVKAKRGVDRPADPIELLARVRGEVANDIRPRKKGAAVSNDDVEQNIREIRAILITNVKSSIAYGVKEARFIFGFRETFM
jgi:hypothetical protein